MMNQIKLKFSEKYGDEHAQRYLHKHRSGLSRRLSNWRDMQMARKALEIAGEPGLVLDLPCGAGRFWPVLAEKQNRVIMAADNSESMLRTAAKGQPMDIVERIELRQMSAFDTGLADNAVDTIFCMRLLHHIGDAEHRRTLLSEFHRVTRETVIISLWVDGNFKAWRRQRHEQKRREQNKKQAYQNRFVLPEKTVEAEFAQAGFDIQARLDFIPFYAMWRVYVLRKNAD